MEKKDWKSSFADYERILGVLSVATGDNLEGVYQAFKARLIEETNLKSRLEDSKTMEENDRGY